MAPTLQQSYSRSVNVLKTFQQNTANSRIVLYQPGLVSPYDRVASLRYYGFITDLRVKIDINSIEESPIPNLDVTSSRTDRITAVRDMEWRSPRKQLDLFLRNSSSDWVNIASVSLLNRMPYYHLNLLGYLSDTGAFCIGNDSALAAQITDVGYGLLGVRDYVSFFGSVREEVTVLADQGTQISFSTDFNWLVSQQSALILPANPNRLQATFINTSLEHEVYLSYNPVAVAGRGITLMRGGGSYEINSSNLYRGAISAVASGAASLSAIEAV
jgi:hypothetical protein